MAYRDPLDSRNRDAKLRHYYRNKQQYLDRNVDKKRQLRALMDEGKSKPCMDCGGVFRPVAMDYDHRDPSTKLWTPSRLAGSGSLRVMREELAKCDLVCANCHRLREEARRLANPRKTAAAEIDALPTVNPEDVSALHRHADPMPHAE